MPIANQYRNSLIRLIISFHYRFRALAQIHEKFVLTAKIH